MSTRSGAILASSSNYWTDVCPVIHQVLPSRPSVDIVADRDPLTGHTLAVDVIKTGEVARGFDSQTFFCTQKIA